MQETIISKGFEQNRWIGRILNGRRRPIKSQHTVAEVSVTGQSVLSR